MNKESDQEFLARHNFDQDVPRRLEIPFSDAQIRVENLLRRHPGERITVNVIVGLTGLHPTYVTHVLSRSEYVAPLLFRKDGYVTSWLITAKPLPPTSEGLLEEILLTNLERDELARQAREDFAWTQTRGKGGRRRRHKAISHW